VTSNVAKDVEFKITQFQIYEQSYNCEEKNTRKARGITQ
jgi:hypothetical protein